MVEQIDNPANKSMHYGRTNVGILNPPNKLPNVVLFSPQQANYEYDQMQYDIYQKQKHAKPPTPQEFPTILKIIGGMAAAGGILIFKKDIIKYLKGLFKKNPKI